MGDLTAGSVFAGHRIDEVAGRGGMGVVYRATHLGLERTVALKVIAAEFVADAGFRERFKRESRVAAGIDHPNVVPVYEAGEEDGALFISMRYVDGTDLGKVIAEEGRIDVRRAVAIVDQVAYALDAAHEAGLIHRDVKPANVLIEQRPRGEHANLTDFGLTKRANSASGETATGMFVGTIDYIAPEQLEGKGQLDARADIYSLGCVFYHSLTGRVPFERDTHLATMFAHASEPPPSARDLVPEVPQALDEVVRRAMAKAPDDRFPSAGDFGRAALAAVQGGRVTRAERIVATGAAAPGEAGTAPPAPPAPPPAAAEPVFEPAPTETASTPVGRRTRGDQRRARAMAIGGVLAAIAVVVLIVLLIAGGGSEDGAPSDTPEAAEAEIRADVMAAQQAAVDGDAAAFCGYLSTGAIAELEERGDIDEEVPTCEALVEEHSQVLPEIAGAGVTVTDVTVTGSTATLTGQVEGDGVSGFVDIGEPVTVDLVQEGGEWKLDEVPGSS